MSLLNIKMISGKHGILSKILWIKRKSKVEFPTYFLNNGKYVCGAKNIADKFNEYFTEIGPSLASEIDVSNKSPFNTHLTSPCTSSFYFQYKNPSSILKIIQGLKPKTSAGYDHLSSKVLKDIADVVSTPLSIIINQSICSGIFPSKLKIAKVIPLFKKGDIQLFGNYRPISLLSSVSKVFEKAAYGQLYEYFSSHALFYDSQYGFRKYHSTELAALKLVDRIHKEIDEIKFHFRSSSICQKPLTPLITTHCYINYSTMELQAQP